jgi:L-rhamnonate dehydratase
MKITRVAATPLNVPLHIALAGIERNTSLEACLVEVETDEGVVGHGLAAITRETVIAEIVNRVIAPAIKGDDALATERVWDKLYWTLLPRGQTGFGAQALSAVDIALWDIKGKAFGEPVWRLLGGARQEVPLYATFGFHFFDRDELAAAAKLWVSQGYRRLKMVVGHEALRRRETRALSEVIREDAARVRAVREAVGPDIELYIDANCSLDLYHATRLAEMVKPYGISFFEEPITQNDALQMAELRRLTGMPLACGQNDGLIFRFRDLLLQQAVDYLQPNVVSSGGFTQCAKIAGLGARLQRAAGEWRRLALPQHASAGRARQWRPGGDALPRGRVVQENLPRAAGAAGWIADAARYAGSRLRARSRRRCRSREIVAAERGLIGAAPDGGVPAR